MIAYTHALVVGSPYPMAMSILYIVAGLLMVSGAWLLRKNQQRGWWLCWAAMLVTATTGFFYPVPAEAPVSSLFYGAFMMGGSGFFFRDLAKPEVYLECFDPETLPATAFGAMPGILVVAGAIGMCGSGEIGIISGSVLLVGTAIFSRWIFSPMFSLIKGRTEWHAA